MIFPVIVFATYVAFAVAGPPAWSQQGTGEEILLEADNVTYDTERSIVSAAGNVEIVLGEQDFLTGALLRPSFRTNN